MHYFSYLCKNINCEYSLEPPLLCFEQKYEKYQILFSENFHFLVVKFSVYLNRHVFVMQYAVYVLFGKTEEQTNITVSWKITYISLRILKYKPLHWWTLSEPLLVVLVPTGQLLQVTLFIVSWKVPSGHDSQLLFSSDMNIPIGQPAEKK